LADYWGRHLIQPTHVSPTGKLFIKHMPVLPPLQISPPIVCQTDAAPPRRKVRTCRHWVRGICIRGPDSCNFLHAFTDPTKQGLCARQLRGECAFAETCYYQHLTVPMKDYIESAEGTSCYAEMLPRLALKEQITGGFSLPSVAPRRITSSSPETRRPRYSLAVSPERLNQLSKSAPPTAPPSPQPAIRHRKIKTCRAWATGNCTRPDEQCDFLHAWTNPYKAGICHRYLAGICGYSSERCYHQHINCTLDEYVSTSQGTKSFQELMARLEAKKSDLKPFSADRPGTISQRLGMSIFTSMSNNNQKAQPPKTTQTPPLTSLKPRRDLSPLLNACSFYPSKESSIWNGDGTIADDAKSAPGDCRRSSLLSSKSSSMDSAYTEHKMKIDNERMYEYSSRRSSLTIPTAPSRDGKSVGGDEQSSTCSEMPDRLGLHKMLMSDSEEFVNAARNSWERKPMDDWTPDDVFHFILSLSGKSEYWKECASIMKNQKVDGKTLSVYENVEELMEDGYGLKRPHARVLVRAIKDFNRQ